MCIYELDERSLSIRTKHYPLVAGFEIYELLALDRGTKVEPRGGRLLPPDQYSIGRAFYEAAKNVAAGGPK